MQRRVRVVGTDCEQQVRGHKAVDGLLPRDVQRLLQVQHASAADECSSLMSGNEKPADVVQDVDGAYQREFAPAAATDEAALKQLHQRERPTRPRWEQVVLSVRRRQHLGETEVLVGKLVLSFEVLTVHFPPHQLEVLS